MANRKPNVVVILSDQQRADTLRCYGNDWTQVPNLNALAANSFVFDNAYVTQPVCTPARASLLTGLYPHTAGPIVNKMALPTNVPTIAELVSAGYLCGYFGKWHLGDDVIPQHGFAVWVSAEDGHRAEYSRREYLHRFSDYHQYLIQHGFEPDHEVAGARIFSAHRRAELPEEHQMALFLGETAADFISQNRDRPFLMYVSTFEPHPPYAGPLNGLYDAAKLPVGPAFLKHPEGASLYNRSRSAYYLQFMKEGVEPGPNEYIHDAATGHNLRSELDWRRLRAQYLANITLVDRMVARIVAALEDADVADNTMVVFTSEHGEMAGDHGMLEKRAFYEEASRVPLLVRIPWLNSTEKHIGGSVGHIDLVPTLLDLAGERSPAHLQGKSLVPILQGESSADDNPVFMQWNGVGSVPDRHLGNETINLMNAMPWRSIVHRRWKLNLCATDQCELFELNADPHEMRNLFNDRQHRDLVRQLAARLRLWQRATGDHAPLPDL
ncbi:MAG: sulfatase-like hydrolase/transferase [Chloroflexi bacterium]|nr:sulfatase-like hydrolase/transferase [Chloroflexota bacterium]